MQGFGSENGHAPLCSTITESRPEILKVNMEDTMRMSWRCLLLRRLWYLSKCGEHRINQKKRKY